jgi:hypothetical protein
MPLTFHPIRLSARREGWDCSSHFWYRQVVLTFWAGDLRGGFSQNWRLGLISRTPRQTSCSQSLLNMAVGFEVVHHGLESSQYPNPSWASDRIDDTALRPQIESVDNSARSTAKSERSSATIPVASVVDDQRWSLEQDTLPHEHAAVLQEQLVVKRGSRATHILLAIDPNSLARHEQLPARQP